MAVIRPFKAIRPTKENVEKVASVPYDVVNREEAFIQAKGNPLNFLRVTRSEIELDESVNPYDEIIYQTAKENYIKLKTQAPLIQDEKELFYLYRQVMGTHSQIGITATFSVEDYDNDIIMKHEKTRKVKEDDRTNHIVKTGAQTGVVFLTYKGVEAVNKIIKQTETTTEPLYDFTSDDGIRHTIWIIPEDFNDIIIYELEQVDKLYIADGHHRAASASRAKRVKQNENSNHSGNEEYNFFIAVLFDAAQLKIMPYNRVVFDLNGNTCDSLIEKIQTNFFVETTETAEVENAKTIKMYLDKKWYRLTPNQNIKNAKLVGDNLDVSILQNYLLTPFLGIGDPRTDTRIDFIGGIRGTKELEKLVESEKAKIAFSMFPISVDDLINISNAGETMPPKSTWFEPKLRDGLLIHEI
jgi:uncharacterized protein (DUF1015 family)